jgi:hypothetical protein
LVFAENQSAYDAAQASIISALKATGLQKAEKQTFDEFVVACKKALKASGVKPAKTPAVLSTTSH